MQSPLGGDTMSLVSGFIKVATKLNDLRPEHCDRRILIRRVAMRKVYGRCQSRAPGGESDRLTMIAPGGGNHAAYPWLRLPQAMHVYQATAHLESAGRCVIFVLDAHFAASACVQLGPRVERRRLDELVHEVRGLRQLGQRERRLSVHTRFNVTSRRNTVRSAVVTCERADVVPKRHDGSRVEDQPIPARIIVPGHPAAPSLQRFGLRGKAVIQSLLEQL